MHSLEQVQNFLPGSLEKMGLGYADMEKINPGHARTILTSIRHETKRANNGRMSNVSMHTIKLSREEMHPSM